MLIEEKMVGKEKIPIHESTFNDLFSDYVSLIQDESVSTSGNLSFAKIEDVSYHRRWKEVREDLNSIIVPDHSFDY